MDALVLLMISRASAQSGCVPSPLPGFSCAANGTDEDTGAPTGFVLHWALVDVNTLALAGEAPTDSWVAVGFSANGSMVGSEAVVGVAKAPPGTPPVQSYKLVAKNVKQPAASVQAINGLKIENASLVTSSNGKLLLSFERSVPDGGSVPVQLNGIQNIIWAFGPNGSAWPSFHRKNYGNIPVDFSAAPSGGASAPDSVPTSSANPVVQAGSRRLASASARRRLLTAPAPSPGGIPRACTKSTLPGYDCEVVADASLGYVFHYAYRPPSVSFFVTATTPGWISLAVSPSGKMAGSDAVVASPGAKLQSYLLNGHAPSSVVPASASFRDGSVSNGNGTMTMRFTRNFTVPGRVPINSGGSTFIIWAMAEDTTAPFPGAANHGPNKGTLSIAFGSGLSGLPVAATNGPSKSLYDAHSWMMWVAFGVLFPLGVLIARFGKAWDPYWFYAHLGIQILAVCVATAAGAISLAKFKVGYLLHSQVGLAVLILIWNQPVLGLIRPHKGTLFRAPWFLSHWLIGTTAILLGWINIYWGLDRYRLRFGGNLRVWYVLWSILLSFWAFLFLFLSDWPNSKAQTGRLNGSHQGVAGFSFKGNIPATNGAKTSRAVEQQSNGNGDTLQEAMDGPEHEGEKV